MKNTGMTYYIGEFCRDFGYPEEAVQVLEHAGRVFWDDAQTREILEQGQEELLSGHGQNTQAVLESLSQAARLRGIHPYTAHLVFFIGLSRPLREVYRQRGISMDIYRDSMLDLKWKLLECRQVYGVWGSFVAWWFPGFFDMTRFALGRLQYEKMAFGQEYQGPGRILHSDSPVVNMHVPSSGPLTMAECMDSFKKAYAFYRKDFPEGPIPFTCCSWLLFPEHERMLPRTSHIRQFQSLFEILEWGYDPEGGDLWRIFGCVWDGDIGKLPKDTSLRQVYAARLAAGEKPGWGRGLFFFDGERLLKGEG